jgi:hypothetical protein
MEDCRCTRRVGVVLLRRPDGLIHPVADGWDGIAVATEALRRDRRAWELSLLPRRLRGAGVATATPN